MVISLTSFVAWDHWRVKAIQVNKISLEDRQRLGSIVLMIASNPDGLETVYNSFWDILEKYGVESGSQLTHLKKDLSKLFFLPKLFYEDARNSIKNNKSFKSVNRERLEKQFFEAGFLTQQQIQSDDETMKLISHRKPIAAAHGVEIFIDEKRITEMLREWNDREMEEIINKLFTP